MKNDKRFLLVEVDAKTKNEFKAHCVRKNVSLKEGIDLLMRKAVKNKK